MSKEELNKWFNKWRLWMILHPEKENRTMLDHCHRCKHHLPPTTYACPSQVIAISSSTSKIVYVSNTGFFQIPGFFQGSWCIEWIKHV
jgi:hypothetical protein